MKATIFSIQRTSFVDGPGVRTTVFFKGCNLRCLWCHNPESRNGRPQLLYFRSRCTRCGQCRAQCAAIGEDFSVDYARCTACGRCEEICPNGARELSGRMMSAEAVFAEILPDRAYYEATGGGVTFSGGECMLNIGFLRQMLILCRDEGIHTAVDTAGNVPFSDFEQILPYTDLFLYDIKALNGQIHKQLTGVDNQLILDNYKRLWSICPEKMHVRVLVVPGWNEGELPGIAEFLRAYPPPVVELLPYHKLGVSKSLAMGEAPFLAPEPSAREMAAHQALFNEICDNGG